jgi:hypothetical protein
MPDGRVSQGGRGDFVKKSENVVNATSNFASVKEVRLVDAEMAKYHISSEFLLPVP